MKKILQGVRALALLAVLTIIALLYWDFAPPKYALQTGLIRLSSSPNFIARSLADILADRINCKYFEAIPGDNVSDVAAFHNYRNWCRKWSKNMYLTEGVYTLDDSVHHPGNTMHIRGEGFATKIQVTSASTRAAFVMVGTDFGSIEDLYIDWVPNASTNGAGIEVTGGSYFSSIKNVFIGKRHQAGGNHRGIFLNFAAGEVLWLSIDHCKIVNFKYGIDGGGATPGNGHGDLHVINSHVTDCDENIRLGYGGGTQLTGNTVGGSRGLLGLHLINGADDMRVSGLFCELQGADVVAQVQVDSGANRNSFSLINGGNQPGRIDGGRDNDWHITGASLNVGGGYEPTNYRSYPFLDLRQQSTANLFNGGLYLTNTHDSTAASGATGNGMVFQQKVSAGGAINPTSAIYGYRVTGGNNLGGISFRVANYSPIEGMRLQYEYLKLNYGDLEIVQPGKNLIMKSPNGARWRIKVNNAGAIETSEL